MRQIIRVHSNLFVELPGTNNHQDKKHLISDFQSVVERLKSMCASFHEYTLREADQRDYFQNIRNSAIIRAGKSVDGTFYTLNQFLISLSPLVKLEVLSTDQRRKISKSITLQARINEIVREYATDSRTKETFDTVKQTCDNLLQSFAEVPVESLPDQVSWVTDNPQS